MVMKLAIKGLVPHRWLALWLSGIRWVEFYESDHDKWAETILKPHRWWFWGHFPGNPIAAGHFLVEATNLVANALLSNEMSSNLNLDGQFSRLVVLKFSIIEFHQPAKPNVPIIIRVQLVDYPSMLQRKIRVGERVMHGEITQNGKRILSIEVVGFSETLFEHDRTQRKSHRGESVRSLMLVDSVSPALGGGGE